jgi:hypothetical protein
MSHPPPPTELRLPTPDPDPSRHTPPPRDCQPPGFAVNRVFFPYTMSACLLADCGANPYQVGRDTDGGVCMHVRARVCVRACVRACMWVCVCVWGGGCLQAYMCACMCRAGSAFGGRMCLVIRRRVRTLLV